jgi:hypothetical protein
MAEGEVILVTNAGHGHVTYRRKEMCCRIRVFGFTDDQDPVMRRFLQ